MFGYNLVKFFMKLCLEKNVLINNVFLRFFVKEILCNIIFKLNIVI